MHLHMHVCIYMYGPFSPPPHQPSLTPMPVLPTLQASAAPQAARTQPAAILPPKTRQASLETAASAQRLLPNGASAAGVAAGAEQPGRHASARASSQHADAGEGGDTSFDAVKLSPEFEVGRYMGGVRRGHVWRLLELIGKPQRLLRHAKSGGDGATPSQLVGLCSWGSITSIRAA